MLGLCILLQKYSWVLLEVKLRFKVKLCKETFFCGLKVKMFNNLYLMFDWLMIFSFGVESDRFWQSYEVLLKVKIILDEWEKSKLLMSFFIIVFNVKLHSFLKVQTLEFEKLLNKVIKLRILQKIDEQNVLIKNVSNEQRNKKKLTCHHTTHLRTCHVDGVEGLCCSQCVDEVTLLCNLIVVKCQTTYINWKLIFNFVKWKTKIASFYFNFIWISFLTNKTI